MNAERVDVIVKSDRESSALRVSYQVAHTSEAPRVSRGTQVLRADVLGCFRCVGPGTVAPGLVS